MQSGSLTYELSKREGTTIVEPRGALDATTAKPLEETLAKVLQEGSCHVNLHLAQVPYITSVGLRAILMTAKECNRRSGKLTFSGLTEAVEQVFELAGFTTLFTIE